MGEPQKGRFAKSLLESTAETVNSQLGWFVKKNDDP